MNYDISFRVRAAHTDRFVEVGECQANVTWNVREIIELSTGLPWLNEKNNGLCIDIMPKIQQGLSELLKHPEKYKPYEAENDWGTVEDTIHFFQQILSDWSAYVGETDPEIVAVTTFWVV